MVQDYSRKLELIKSNTFDEIQFSEKSQTSRPSSNRKLIQRGQKSEFKPSRRSSKNKVLEKTLSDSSSSVNVVIHPHINNHSELIQKITTKKVLERKGPKKESNFLTKIS